MAFTPHWIDTFPNSISSNFGIGNRSENIVRIGNILYGVFVNEDFATDFGEGTWRTYKSIDFGVTWTDTTVAPDFSAFSSAGPYRSWVVRTFVRSGKMEMFAVPRDTSFRNILWSTYDPVSNAWNTAVDTGLKFWFRSSGSNLSTLFADLRPDGSIIIAFPDGDGASPFYMRISKYASGAWSTIGGLIDQNDPVNGIAIYLHQGLLTSNGDAHLLVGRSQYDGLGGSYLTLNHVSIEAATDTISSEHLIEDQIDFNIDWDLKASINVGPGDSAGTTLLFSYGYRVSTNQVEGPSFATTPYGTLRVAIGDMTVDPLNPVWNVTTVTTQMSVDFSYNFLQAQNVILSGTLWVYYVTTDPLANPLDGMTRLWRSYWTGSVWHTPELWYDPSTDATLATAPIVQPGVPGSTPVGVSNFYLLKAFTNGVGIILNVDGHATVFNGPQRWAAYDGPTPVPSNIASLYAARTEVVHQISGVGSGPASLYV